MELLDVVIFAKNPSTDLLIVKHNAVNHSALFNTKHHVATIVQHWAALLQTLNRTCAKFATSLGAKFDL